MDFEDLYDLSDDELQARLQQRGLTMSDAWKHVERRDDEDHIPAILGVLNGDGQPTFPPGEANRVDP